MEETRARVGVGVRVGARARLFKTGHAGYAWHVRSTLSWHARCTRLGFVEAVDAREGSHGYEAVRREAYAVRLGQSVHQQHDLPAGLGWAERGVAWRSVA